MKAYLVSLLTLFGLMTSTPLSAKDEFATLAAELKREAAEMDKLYAKAKECFPAVTALDSKLCTGLVLKPADVQALMTLDVAACQAEIKSRGFEPYTTQRPRAVSPEDYESFLTSTKLAQIFYEEKVVLFKNPLEPLTCIHELLHIRARSPAVTDSLSPRVRQERQDNLLRKMGAVVKLVEAKERAGDKKRAQQMADTMQPVFDALVRWKSLHDLLDEKDVHGWLWQECRLGLFDEICSLKQQDVALANLWIRREFIPKAMHAEIMKAGQAVMKKIQGASGTAKKK